MRAKRGSQITFRSNSDGFTALFYWWPEPKITLIELTFVYVPVCLRLSLLSPDNADERWQPTPTDILIVFIYILSVSSYKQFFFCCAAESLVCDGNNHIYHVSINCICTFLARRIIVSTQINDRTKCFLDAEQTAKTKIAWIHYKKGLDETINLLLCLLIVGEISICKLFINIGHFHLI